MDCACGHHHAPTPDLSGTPVPMKLAPITLHGRLICHDMAQLMTALELLPGHVAASRAEPGCLHFDIAQSDDPMVWTLSEIFADDDAFAAHQTRTKASPWGRDSASMGRDFHRHPAQVLIREGAASDNAARVAHINGVTVGHRSMDGSVVVHPALRGRGIEDALIG